MTLAFTPRTLDEAIRALTDHPELVPVAGCTDLMVTTPQRRSAMNSVIDLLGIREINGIRSIAGAVEIGSTTTFAAIGRSPEINQWCPALAEAARVIGGWQIQSRATIGGNIANASPAGDSLPVLLALDATVVAAGNMGMREIPYEHFNVGYRRTALQRGELVAWVRLPQPAGDSVQAFRKVGTRQAQAISKVVIAWSAVRDGNRLSKVRFGAGSVAPTPVRLHATEAVCEGAVLDDALADRAAQSAEREVKPVDDVRSTSEYRRFVVGRVVRRLLLDVHRPSLPAE